MKKKYRIGEQFFTFVAGSDEEKEFLANNTSAELIDENTEVNTPDIEETPITTATPVSDVEEEEIVYDPIPLEEVVVTAPGISTEVYLGMQSEILKRNPKNNEEIQEILDEYDIEDEEIADSNNWVIRGNNIFMPSVSEEAINNYRISQVGNTETDTIADEIGYSNYLEDLPGIIDTELATTQDNIQSQKEIVREETRTFDVLGTKLTPIESTKELDKDIITADWINKRQQTVEQILSAITLTTAEQDKAFAIKRAEIGATSDLLIPKPQEEIDLVFKLPTEKSFPGFFNPISKDARGRTIGERFQQGDITSLEYQRDDEENYIPLFGSEDNMGGYSNIGYETFINQDPERFKRKVADADGNILVLEDRNKDGKISLEDYRGEALTTVPLGLLNKVFDVNPEVIEQFALRMPDLSDIDADPDSPGAKGNYQEVKNRLNRGFQETLNQMFSEDPVVQFIKSNILSEEVFVNKLNTKANELRNKFDLVYDDFDVFADRAGLELEGVGKSALQARYELAMNALNDYFNELKGEMESANLQLKYLWSVYTMAGGEAYDAALHGWAQTHYWDVIGENMAWSTMMMSTGTWSASIAKLRGIAAKAWNKFDADWLDGVTNQFLEIGLEQETYNRDLAILKFESTKKIVDGKEVPVELNDKISIKEWKAEDFKNILNRYDENILTRQRPDNKVGTTHMWVPVEELTWNQLFLHHDDAAKESEESIMLNRSLAEFNRLAQSWEQFEIETHDWSLPAIVGSVIEQVPHMGPMIGGAVVSGIGAFLGNPFIVYGGYSLSAIGMMNIGVMEYAAMRNQMAQDYLNKEHGVGNWDGNDYLEYLKRDIAGEMAIPATTAVGIAAVERFAIGRTFGLTTNMLKGGGSFFYMLSDPGKNLVKKEWGKIVSKLPSTLGSFSDIMATNFVQEVTQNAMSQFTTQAFDTGSINPFNYQIDTEQMLLEGYLALKPGLLFGTAGVTGTQAIRETIGMTKAYDLFTKLDMQIPIVRIGMDAWLQEEIDRINNSNISQSKKDQRIKELNALRNSAIPIPANVTGVLKSKLLDLLLENYNLENKIKKLGKTTTKADQERQKTINEEITQILVNAETEQQLDHNINTIQTLIDKYGKGNIVMKIFANQKLIDEYVKKSKLKGYIKSAEADQGTILQNPKTGEQLIIINKEQSIKDKAVTVASHEFLHALLFKTIQANPGIMKVLAPLLRAEIDKINIDEITDAQLKAKLAKYEDTEFKDEELFTYFSDFLLKGKIKIDQDWVEDLKDIFRRIFQDMGLKIHFDSSASLINFVKDYANSITREKLTRAQQNMLEKGIDIDKDNLKPGDAITPLMLHPDNPDLWGYFRADGSFQEVIFEDPAVDLGVITKKSSKSEQEIEDEIKFESENIDDIVNQTNEMLLETIKSPGVSESTITQSVDALINNNIGLYKRALMFDDAGILNWNEDIMPLLKSMIYDLIRTYKPVVNGKPIKWTTYAMPQIFNRRSDIYGPAMIGKEGVSFDDEKAREIKDQQEDKDFDEIEEVDTTRPWMYPSSKSTISENLLLSPKEVDRKWKRDFLSAIQNFSDLKDVVKFLVEATKKDYFVDLKGEIGTLQSEKYREFVTNLVNEGLLDIIPVATLKRRFGKIIDLTKISTTPTIKKDTGSRYDKGVYSIPKVEKQKLIDYWLPDPNKEYTKKELSQFEKRQQSLFSLLAEGLMVEGVRDAVNDKAFMERLQTLLDMIFWRNESAKDLIEKIIPLIDKRTIETTSLDVIAKQRKAANEKEAKENEELFQLNVEKTLYQNEFQYVTDLTGEISLFEQDKRDWNSIQYEFITKVLIPKYQREGKWNKLLTLPKLIDIEKGKGVDFSNKDTKEAYLDWIFMELAPYLPASMLLSTGTVVHGATSKLTPFKKTGELKEAMKNYGVDKKGNIVKINNENKDSVKELTEEDFGNKLDDSFKIEVDGKVYTGKEAKDFLLAADKRSKFSGHKTKDTVEYEENGKVKKRKVNLLNTNWFEEWWGSEELNTRNENKVLGFKIFAKILHQTVQKDALNAIWVIQMFRGTSTNQDHIMRTWAPVKAIDKSVIGGDFLVEEHTIPASWLAKLLIPKIIGSDTKLLDKYLKVAGEKYQQWILSETQAEIVDMHYKSTMPFGWDFLKDHTYSRIFNPINIQYDGGIDSNSIEVLDGNTIQNKDNVNNAGTIITKSSKGARSSNSDMSNAINDNQNTIEQVGILATQDKAAQNARALNQPVKGISIFDFDDTLALTSSKVIVTFPNGRVTKITPSEFAKRAQRLEERGAKFDFSEFNKVIDGKPGPLINKLKKAIDKFGNANIFVLTARPQASAYSIYEFLKGLGLEIPLNNIVGLENGTAQAKADWVIDKAAEGYNDFFFVDDVYANVEAVQNALDQIDVNRDVQIAKSAKGETLNKEFNQIIEDTTGKEWFKRYSPARAKTEGASQGKFEFFIPPSAEDFVGLLYKLLGKGKQGDAHMAWFKKYLIDPFNQGEQQLISAKISAANDFVGIQRRYPNVPNNLNKPTGIGAYTYDHAIRVFIWTQQGVEIPGLSKRDQLRLNTFVLENGLKDFALEVMTIQKTRPYPSPEEYWVSGTIDTDIIGYLNKVIRREYLQEFDENVEIIFSKENLYKLEALYGKAYVDALKDILRRMRSGSNRPIMANEQVETLLDYFNSSVGVVMFINTRSALLQLISNINFLNWSDNNPVMAAAAFANQPKYWNTVIKLMNSDYLVQRRNGMRINVSESEVVEASKKGGINGVVSYLLNKGFILTRIADSFAIATGGASFYINRTNSYIKEGYSQKEAEAKAFDDFYQISEETQQSSRTDRISMQQASPIGRLILAFANTPMQYARLIKKAYLDLVNKRGDWRTNVSKILYYTFIQNMIFNAMQQALFVMMFREDPDDDKNRTDKQKSIDIMNGMADSLLRGLGWAGAAVATIKNVILELIAQHGKESPEYEEALWNLFDFSPPIDSKIRQLRSAAKTFSWNKAEMKRRGWSIDNPAYLATAQVVSAGFNLPLERVLRKTMNLRVAFDHQTELWQTIALIMGYSTWDLGLPYWGLPSTIENEMEEDARAKDQFKADVRKLKNMGYKKTMKPEDYNPDDIVEITSPAGTLMYYVKILNNKKK